MNAVPPERSAPRAHAKTPSSRLGLSAVKRPAGAATRIPAVLLAPALLVTVAIALPIAYLLLRAAQADPATLREIIWRPRLLQLLANTLLLAGTVVVTSTAVALPLAWLATHARTRAHRLITLFGVLPLAVPSYVGAFALLAASGPGGFVDAVTPWNLPTPRGFAGAVLILTLFNFPYLFLNFWAAFRRLDPALTEAARTLGKTPLAAFARVTLPSLRPAWLAGSLLIALHVLGDFSVVSLMRYETFSAAIYQQYTAAYDRVYSAWLALMLLTLTGVIVWLESRLLRRAFHARTGTGVARPTPPVPLGPWRAPAFLFAAVVTVATLILPLASITYWLRLGLANPFVLPEVTDALLRSVQAAALAALTTTTLALPLALIGVRYPGRRARFFARVAYLGYATPPLALALAVIFFVLRITPPLYQTLPLLIMTYTLHFLAEATGPVRSALYLATPRLEEAARTLGVSPARAFARVTLPLIRPGLLASAALVFVSALKELPIALLLAPTGFDTLARNVWSYTEEALFAEAAPYALCIVLASAVFVGLLLRQERS